MEGIGQSPTTDPPSSETPPQSWDDIAERCGTTGTAAARKARHVAERARYREALERRAEHRSKAVVVVRDGHQVLVPAPRADEIPSGWHIAGGQVLDPATGQADPQWRVATDGRLILITPSDQRTYDELAAAQVGFHAVEVDRGGAEHVGEAGLGLRGSGCAGCWWCGRLGRMFPRRQRTCGSSWGCRVSRRVKAVGQERRTRQMRQPYSGKMTTTRGCPFIRVMPQ
ncbi:hypothetical protein [Actinacidiphila oryziradicis]|uniref:hypothetical protein n=1 Tax=Actinacidiphila oryziradicis TaxID=2571141 RepID=UPI001B80A01A|nr:hypothetical protein [Actinacidiphila oryziradicis]